MTRIHPTVVSDEEDMDDEEDFSPKFKQVELFFSELSEYQIQALPVIHSELCNAIEFCGSDVQLACGSTKVHSVTFIFDLKLQQRYTYATSILSNSNICYSQLALIALWWMFLEWSPPESVLFD